MRTLGSTEKPKSAPFHGGRWTPAATAGGPFGPFAVHGGRWTQAATAGGPFGPFAVDRRQPRPAARQ